MNRRSLHARAAWVFSGVVGLLTILVAVVSVTALRNSLLRLEEKSVLENLARLRAVAGDSLEDLTEKVRFHSSAESAPPHAGSILSEPGAQPWVARVTERGAHVDWMAKPSAAEGAAAKAMSGMLLRELALNGFSLLPARDSFHVAGILNIAEGTFLYAAILRRPADTALAPDWVVGLLPLDRRLLKLYSDRLFLEPELLSAPSVGTDPVALRIAHAKPHDASRVLSPDRVAGYASFADLSNSRPIVLRVETGREFYQAGLTQVYLLIAGVALTGVIVGLVGWHLIDRWVVARVRDLRQQVAGIAACENLDRRVSFGEADELAELAASVNQLLDALARRTDELGAEIRERIKVQERLSAANRELQATLQFRQDLSNMLVHDIRSPLTVIDFYLQIQARRMGPAAFAADQSLNLATKSVTRLNLMINDLLIMAKFEAGKVSLNRSVFDLRSAIVRNIDEMRFLAQKRHVAIRDELGVDELTVDLDANLLWRVIENLLTNAVKYSPDNTAIIVRAEGRSGIPGAEAPANADHVLLSVIDEGPGIPTELHETIFEKFNIGRLDKSKLQIGLGLSFCRMIVEAQGGRIWVENNEPRGSIFRVELPAVVPVRATAEGVRG